MTWGLVAGFAAWLLGRGYAIGTVNDRVKVVKNYCRLAMQAGALDRGEWNAIQALRSYGHTEGKRVDAGRPTTRARPEESRGGHADRRASGRARSASPTRRKAAATA